MTVQEVKAKLDMVRGTFMAAQLRKDKAEAELAEAEKEMVEVGLDPEGDLDAQVKGYQIKAERATEKAYGLLQELQVKVNA